MNIDLKEVRGQGNVLWKEEIKEEIKEETFDIIVDLSSFDIRDVSGVTVTIFANYESTSYGRAIFPKPKEKETRISGLPCGKEINIYFERRGGGYGQVGLYMNFYNESTGTEQEKFILMNGKSTGSKVTSEKTLITNGHNSTMPMTIKLLPWW